MRKGILLACLVALVLPPAVADQDDVELDPTNGFAQYLITKPMQATRPAISGLGGEIRNDLVDPTIQPRTLCWQDGELWKEARAVVYFIIEDINKPNSPMHRVRLKQVMAIDTADSVSRPAISFAIGQQPLTYTCDYTGNGPLGCQYDGLPTSLFGHLKTQGNNTVWVHRADNDEWEKMNTKIMFFKNNQTATDPACSIEE